LIFYLFIFFCFELSRNFVDYIREKIKKYRQMSRLIQEIPGIGPARPRRLKRILVRGDLYLCRKSSTRFSSSSSAQADPISRRVLGNALSDR